jgi:leucyl aminopeptidase
MPIEIQLRVAPPRELGGDLLAMGVFGAPEGGELMTSSLKDVDTALDGALRRQFEKEEFTGKQDQSVRLDTLGRLGTSRLVILGLGEPRSFGSAAARAFAARAARAANAEKAASLGLVIPDAAVQYARSIAEGLELGAYRFTKYMTGDRTPKTELTRAILGFEVKTKGKTKLQIELGQRVGEAINLARDLSNEPGNVMYPESFAAAAARLAKSAGLKIETLDFADIRRRGMKLIEAVGRGSAREPRLVHLSYVPKGAKRVLVFVGKGVTFDSGGLSIKPAAGMGEMKHDMSGAANVVGLMAAVAAIRPKIAVHAVAPCAENMPDGDAYRPGDIWGSLDGRTVEIVNTDAEGRLILADALAFARSLSPDVIVDNATLTGACVVALGPTCTGWYASDEASAQEFEAAVKQSGETMWRMPLLEDLREQIKSDVADVKQVGDRWGGSVVAALFLREFVGDAHWVHCDIAGPAAAEKPSLTLSSKGATGHGILTFLAMIERAAG